MSGRLGVHAYAPYGAIRWERYWRVKKPDELPAVFGAIAKELESQAPTIVTLLEQAAREAEERQRKWEIERRELERKEAERRKVEEEKARVAGFEEQLERWRFSRDARALVAAAQQLVEGRGLRVSKGGPLEEWLDWILKRADETYPLSNLRHDVEEMVTKHGTWARASSPLGTRRSRPVVQASTGPTSALGGSGTIGVVRAPVGTLKDRRRGERERAHLLEAIVHPHVDRAHDRHRAQKRLGAFAREDITRQEPEPSLGCRADWR